MSGSAKILKECICPCMYILAQICAYFVHSFVVYAGYFSFSCRGTRILWYIYKHLVAKGSVWIIS
jgi:hypothetical protein